MDATRQQVAGRVVDEAMALEWSQARETRRDHVHEQVRAIPVPGMPDVRMAVVTDAQVHRIQCSPKAHVEQLGVGAHVGSACWRDCSHISTANMNNIIATGSTMTLKRIHVASEAR